MERVLADCKLKFPSFSFLSNRNTDRLSGSQLAPAIPKSTPSLGLTRFSPVYNLYYNFNKLKF